MPNITLISFIYRKRHRIEYYNIAVTLGYVGYSCR